MMKNGFNVMCNNGSDGGGRGDLRKELEIIGSDNKIPCTFQNLGLIWYFYNLISKNSVF